MLLIKDSEITNQFEMALIAARRAKDLSEGKPALINPKEQNNVIQAIKELKAGMIGGKYENG